METEFFFAEKENGYHTKIEVEIISQGIFDLYTINFEFCKDKESETLDFTNKNNRFKYLKANINKNTVPDMLNKLFEEAIQDNCGTIRGMQLVLSRVVETDKKLEAVTK